MKVIKSLRAPVLVTLVLLLICGLIYPVVMTLMSQALFPSQANGSIIYVDGQAVGAKNVGQDFTDPRFMRCRPSAYQYNTYTVDEEGNKFYNDGSEYAGVASGSNNYGASNPALAERVREVLEKIVTDYAILPAKPNMEEVKRALTVFENHSILQRIEGKFNQADCRFAILPTIQTAVSSERLNEVAAVLRKEETADEETEEDSAD